ncbi:MAG: NAD-dependent epimerase/dehydratase family protein [Planctomycetaceae bacterium]|nr:MAG: NAD-dependent epimerase/dehydratase family protein [Planctomycetaceae bacterium]
MIKDEILHAFDGRNVLVTGGTGLIGRQVVNILCSANAHVKIVSLDKLNVDERALHVYGDLTSFELCKEVAKDIDFIFHLAGVQGTVQTSSSKLASHFVPMLMVNTNIFEAARINKVAKLVYTSTIGAYEDREILKESDYKIESTPMSFAGWAKRMAELQVYAYKVQYGIDTFSIVRLSNIYGPGDNFDPETAMVIPSLMYRIFNGETPLSVWGDGTVIRDFLYSRDAAEGILLALHYGTAGDFVNIASGKGHSIRDIVTALQSFIDFDYLFDATKPSGAPVRVMDITKASELLGFIPSTDLTTGLKHTWEWFVSHSEEYKHKMNYFLPERD